MTIEVPQSGPVSSIVKDVNRILEQLKQKETGQGGEERVTTWIEQPQVETTPLETTQATPKQSLF